MVAVQEIDFADLFALRPRLWSELVAEVNWTDPASVRRFAERAREVVACLTDVHHRLPGLGLTLAQLVELRQKAWLAEDAASTAHAAGKGDFRPAAPLAPAMRRAIVNLWVRGLEPERIQCALSVHPAWVAATLEGVALGDDERAVIRAHLDGLTLPEVTRRTLVPKTTAARWIERWLGEEPRTNRRTDSHARAERAWRMRQQGRALADIAAELDMSEDAVKKAIRRHKPRAAE